MEGCKSMRNVSMAHLPDVFKIYFRFLHHVHAQVVSHTRRCNSQAPTKLLLCQALFHTPQPTAWLPYTAYYSSSSPFSSFNEMPCFSVRLFHVRCSNPAASSAQTHTHTHIMHDIMHEYIVTHKCCGLSVVYLTVCKLAKPLCIRRRFTSVLVTCTIFIFVVLQCPPTELVFRGCAPPALSFSVSTKVS